MNFLYTIIILFKVNELKSDEFGYLRKEQMSWKKKYHECGGQRQSPIKIDSFQAVPLAMSSLKLVNYHNILPDPFKLVNNGHSVSLQMNPNNDTKFVPYIFGAMLENQYVFNDIHFHWGAKNNHGSEHILNNIQYSLEMHVVHRNRKYTTNEEAFKKRDGLVVLAVLFELRKKAYKPLNTIIDKLKLIKEYHSTTKIDSFELISLMPKRMSLFYSYAGSLTTPPCVEAVTWIIFPDPILISKKQINEFRILRNSRNVSLSDNFRFPQATNGRTIYKRIPYKILANRRKLFL